jgi:shikimate 5-dehydrogenase
VLPCAHMYVNRDPLFLFAQSGEFSGFSVTIPYKVDCLSRVSSCTPVATAIGAVNTLISVRNAARLGHNTDWFVDVCICWL